MRPNVCLGLLLGLMGCGSSGGSSGGSGGSDPGDTGAGGEVASTSTDSANGTPSSSGTNGTAGGGAGTSSANGPSSNGAGGQGGATPASSSASASSGSGNPCEPGSEIVGTMSEMSLADPAQPYQIDPLSDDYGRRVTPNNGCSVTVEAGAGFGGTAGIRVVLPDAFPNGDPEGNAEYCGFASGAPLTAGGVEVAQLNVRYALFIGSGYAAAMNGDGPKAIIPYVTDASGNEGLNSRPMVFWGSGVEHGGTLYGAIGVTEGTVQSYQEPETDYWPLGPGFDALYFGPGPDHAGTTTLGTPVIGDEWVVIEHHFDLRRDHGNPDGLNRLFVWTRDGVLAGSMLDIPLTWDGGHEFEGDRFSGFDGLGYYWNLPGVRTADDHVIYSHVTFAANRASDDPIGPPAGFLEECDP
jgi:hypothetical protein